LKTIPSGHISLALLFLTAIYNLLSVPRNLLTLNKKFWTQVITPPLLQMF